ncbi:hypothetical protein [Kitasatospora sp. NPDC050543]|uniref:hypothetical protein n=1 Tax=Kitasatospora sp. NPDC050543 TaxID=3364054 RepID=UPI0037BBB340
MLLLGLLLLAAAGTFTGLLIAENLDGGPSYTVTMFGNDVATMNSLAIFLAGIALTLVFALGCLLVFAGRRSARRRAMELMAARPQVDRAPAVQPRTSAVTAPVDTDPVAPAPTGGSGSPTAPPSSAGEPARAARPRSTGRHRFVHRMGH